MRRLAKFGDTKLLKSIMCPLEWFLEIYVKTSSRDFGRTRDKARNVAVYRKQIAHRRQ